MRINIIGDIAGRYDEFLLLLEKMPEADLVISVGDLIDRGPKSRQVIEWFMANTAAGKAEAIFGNHEDLFLDAISYGDLGDWTRNGGIATILSYIKEYEHLSSFEEMLELAKQKNSTVREIMDLAYFPDEIKEWLKNRPLYYSTDELFISHAPVPSLNHIPEDRFQTNFHFIWNRVDPRQRQDKFFIHGHQGRFKEFKDESGIFGYCIDNCSENELMGIHWPSKEIFKQPYLT